MAEGKRKARILASEADMVEQVNNAKGKAEGLNILCQALAHKQGKDQYAPLWMCLCVFVVEFM